MSSGLKFCVEVGGTFTDWLLVAGRQVVGRGKVLSTPKQPAQGVMQAFAEALVSGDRVAAIIHGSTVATNAVLERKGAATSLITTEGFRDLLDIQRQTRTRLFDLFYRHPEPLIRRDRILEVAERLAPGGEVRRPLELAGLEGRLERQLECGVESVAICLLHSYANPGHERALAEQLRSRFPDLYLTLSSEVLPRFREYERASTTVISAYLKPQVDRYVRALERSLEEGGFAGNLAIMQANGGTVPASEVRRHAARMVLSGPAAGVAGAVAAARASGFGDLLTFDMGGTSTDVCLVTGGQVGFTTDYKIGGLPLSIPMYDIVTVGAGGGSVATVDPGGAMRVGPESAGADPGPACYGKGGSAFTVSDANFLSGLLRPGIFLEGRMRLVAGPARLAAERLAEALALTPVEVASGVVRLANATMAQALRLVSIERGHDPRDYTVVAYGGAGPLHAAQLATELDIPRVLIPRDPGLVSAYGLVLADTRQDYLRTRIVKLPGVSGELLEREFEALRSQARREFERYGPPRGALRLRHGLDMRFEGQAYELLVDVDPLLEGGAGAETLLEAFRSAHLRRYGHVPAGDHVEIVNFRLGAWLPSTTRHLSSPQAEGGATPRPQGGEVYYQGRQSSCRFFSRADLPVGGRVEGLAVIEEPTATVLIPPDWQGRVDERGNLILERR